MKSRYLLLLIFIACSITGFTSAQGLDRVRSRLYKHVQVIDTVSGTWRTLHAFARITYSQDSLNISIWNHWAHESINPLTRITLSSQVQKETTTGKYRYTGLIHRSVGVDKGCYVESYNEITDNKNPSFIVFRTDYSVQYRMSLKAPKKTRVWTK